MNFRFLICLIALPATACTIAPQDNGIDAQIHPPLTYKNWTSNQYVSANGLPVCAVSSGYNGITVTVGKLQNGIDVVVASNRTMMPGTEFTVNVGDKSFETSETYFHPESGRELAEYLAKNDKAYLDWSEIHGPAGGQRIHVQNIARLEDFHTKYKQCRDSLSH